MFFLHRMERIITIHPSYFGPRISEHLHEKLLFDVEGTNTGHYFVICILDAMDVSEGRVIPGNGRAEYTVSYRAIVWRPFKGEVLDGVVSSINQHGINVDVGPLSVFVSTSMIPSDCKYDANATPPQYIDEDNNVIQKGTELRVKIRGVRSEVGNMYAIATIKEDYLGPIDDGKKAVGDLGDAYGDSP